MGNQRDNWALYKRLLAYVRPYRGRLVNGILLTIAFGVSNGAKVAIVKTVWAKVFESGASANLGWAAALFYASLVPLAILVSGVCTNGRIDLAGHERCGRGPECHVECGGGHCEAALHADLGAGAVALL